MQCNAAPDGTGIPSDPGPRTSNFLRIHHPWTGWESLDKAVSAPVASPHPDLGFANFGIALSTAVPSHSSLCRTRLGCPSPQLVRRHPNPKPGQGCGPAGGPWLPALQALRWGQGRSSACLFHRRRPGLTRQQGSYGSLILRGFFGFVVPLCHAIILGSDLDGFR